jgi:imidazolonepropionase-like amidohydrolase
VTYEGAKALGLERQVGTLTAGKWGDAVVIRLTDTRPPVEQVMSGENAVVATYVGGRPVFEGIRA